jgi:hypothetical protein
VAPSPYRRLGSTPIFDVMTKLERYRWLYVRGEASVHITREPLKLTVCGPGDAEKVYSFGDADTLIEFVRLYDGALMRDGWILQAYLDRRARDRDAGAVPASGERRRRARPNAWLTDETE